MDREIQKHIVEIFKDINTIESYSRVMEGYLTTNYILDTNCGKYFLKQYRTDFTEDTVKNIFAVMDFMFKNGIPTINAILDISNRPYFIYDSKIYTLFPFVEDAIQIQDLSETSIKSLAKNLAKVHRLSENGIPFNIDIENSSITVEKFFKSSEQILEIINNKEDKDEFDEFALKAIDIKTDIIKKYGKKLSEYKIKYTHLLHGDYHSKNVFFDDMGEVKYIFDFEKTKIGNRLDELIRSMNYICFDGVYNQENIDKARIYIQEYKLLYDFDKESFTNDWEYHCIKKAHSLWVLRTHYLENSKRVDCFLNNEIALLEFFNKEGNVLVEELLS